MPESKRVRVIQGCRGPHLPAAHGLVVFRRAADVLDESFEWKLRAPVMTAAESDSLFGVLVASVRSASSNSVGMPINKEATLQVSAAGDLWLLRHVRAPGADTIKAEREYLSPNEAPQEGSLPPSVLDRMHHAIVEVVDPASARLLARIELPFRAIPVAPGFVGRTRQGPDGHYLVSVYRLALSK